MTEPADPKTVNVMTRIVMRRLERRYPGRYDFRDEHLRRRIWKVSRRLADRRKSPDELEVPPDLLEISVSRRPSGM